MVMNIQIPVILFLGWKRQARQSQLSHLQPQQRQHPQQLQQVLCQPRPCLSNLEPWPQVLRLPRPCLSNLSNLEAWPRLPRPCLRNLEPWPLKLRGQMLNLIWTLCQTLSPKKMRFRKTHTGSFLTALVVSSFDLAWISMALTLFPTWSKIAIDWNIQIWGCEGTLPPKSMVLWSALPKPWRCGKTPSSVLWLKFVFVPWIDPYDISLWYWKDPYDISLWYHMIWFHVIPW